MTENRPFKEMLPQVLAGAEFNSPVSIRESLWVAEFANREVALAVRDYLRYWVGRENRTEHWIRGSVTLVVDEESTEQGPLNDAENLQSYLRLHLLGQRIKAASALPADFLPCYETDEHHSQQGYFLDCKHGTHAQAIRRPLEQMLREGGQMVSLKQVGLIHAKDPYVSQHLPLAKRSLLEVPPEAATWLNALSPNEFLTRYKHAEQYAVRTTRQGMNEGRSRKA